MISKISKEKAMTTQIEKQYLTEREVAVLTSISLSKLRSDRQRCVGIPFCRIGRSVRYRLSEVEGFLNGCRVDTTHRTCAE